MKTVESLLAELETKVLKARLLVYPEIIQAHKAGLREARETYNEAAARVAMLEAELATDIATETDPNTGKPKFSNDKTRQNELLRRRGTSPEYTEAAQEAREAERRMNELQDELEGLQDKFKSYRYITRLTAEELALLATEETEQEEFTGNGNGKKKVAQAY